MGVWGDGSVSQCHISHVETRLSRQDLALQDAILDGDLFGTDLLPVAMSVFNGQSYFEALDQHEGFQAQVAGCPRCADGKC